MTGEDNELVLRSGDIAGDDADARERVRRHAKQMLVRLELLGDEADGRSEPEPDPEPQTARPDYPGGTEQGSPRNLIIAIVTVPIVFVAVVILSISVFGRPNAEASAGGQPSVAAAIDRIEQPTRGVRAASATYASAFDAIETPDDSRIGSLALDGDRLAMLVESPAGAEVKIYDLARGAMAARVPIEKRREAAVDAHAALDQARERPAAKPDSAAIAPAFEAGDAETGAFSARAPRLKPVSRD